MIDVLEILEAIEPRTGIIYIKIDDDVKLALTVSELFQCLKATPRTQEIWKKAIERYKTKPPQTPVRWETKDKPEKLLLQVKKGPQHLEQHEVLENIQSRLERLRLQPEPIAASAVVTGALEIKYEMRAESTAISTISTKISIIETPNNDYFYQSHAQSHAPASNPNRNPDAKSDSDDQSHARTRPKPRSTSWTTRQIILLHLLYESHNTNELSAIIGRSREAIKHKVRDYRLGGTKANSNNQPRNGGNGRFVKRDYSEAAGRA